MSQVLDAIRAKFPQYSNVGDAQLVGAIGDKYPQYLQHPEFAQEYQQAKQPSALSVGMPVPQANAQPQPPQGVNANPGGFLTDITKSFLPNAPTKDPQEQSLIDYLQTNHIGDVSQGQQAMKGVGDSLVNAAKFATTTPLGLITTAAAPLKLLQPLLLAGFGGYAAAQAKEQAQQLGTEFGKNPEDRDYRKIGEQGTSLGMLPAALLAPVLGGHYASLAKEVIGNKNDILKPGEGLRLGPKPSVQSPSSETAGTTPPVADVATKQQSAQTTQPSNPSIVQSTAVPFDPKGFKEGLKSLSPEDLSAQYQAIQGQSKQMLAQGQLQDASLNITKGQFVREELQNRQANANQTGLPKAEQTPSQSQVAEAKPLSFVPAVKVGEQVVQVKEHQATEATRVISANPGKQVVRGFQGSDGKFYSVLEAARAKMAQQPKITLYRAESPTTKFSDIFNPDKLKAFEHAIKPGEFWTSDPKYADYFKESYGKDATIKQIDISKTEAEKYKVSAFEYKVPQHISKGVQNEPANATIEQQTSNATGQSKKVQGQKGNMQGQQGLPMQKLQTQGQAQSNVQGQIQGGLGSDARSNGGRNGKGKSKRVLSGPEKDIANALGGKGKSKPSQSGSIINPRELFQEGKEKLFGIAERVTKGRSAQGEVETPEPGEGASPGEALALGRQKLAEGVDPHKVLANFKADPERRTSETMIGVFFAHGERLAKVADEAAEKFGIESSEYKAAAKADSDWIKEVKEAQTATSRQFVAQQGEVEVNTGSFHSMARSYTEDTGKEFTKEQASKAQELVGKVKEADAKVQEVQGKLNEALKSLSEEKAKPKVASKTGSQILAEAAKSGVKATGKALEGLNTLFGAGQGKLGTFGAFDEHTWAKAKPLFQEAYKDFKKAGKSLAEFADFALTQWGEAVEPYVQRFASETAQIEGVAQKIKSRKPKSEKLFEPANIETTRKAIAEKSSTASQKVWSLAQEYLNKGENDFDTIRHGIATDLGIPIGEVTKLLSENKQTKALSDEMYKAMDERRKLKQSAEFWLKDQQIPGWQQAIRMVPRVFFLDKIFGHGTVGMITHAGINVFNPGAWSTYFPSFLRQYKLAYSKVYHEQWVQDQIRKPNFVMWKRAGLKADPFRYPDDYQNAAIKSFMGKLGVLVGNYGFDALKDFRINRANQVWNGLSEELKTPEMAKMIADSVNHATGVVHMPFREWASWTFFAPRLEASRWAWMIGDPAKALGTFKEWDKASPEEKWFAMSELKQKAAVAGTYLSLLALNQGYLSATGSDQKVNFNNPRKSDFLSFKVAGHNLGIVGPMLGIVRMFYNLVHTAIAPRGPVESLTPRGPAMGEQLFNYGRGKLSPLAGFGMDVFAQSDFQGKPLPWSEDKVPSYLRKEGQGKYTPGEYAAQQFSPIPVEEAIKEVWSDQGMTTNQIDLFLKALGVAAIAGGTGARVSKDYNEGKVDSPPPVKKEKQAFPIKGMPKIKPLGMNDIIQRGGKNYQVTGFDTDGEPLVQEA